MSETLRFDLLANDRASKVFDSVGNSAKRTESVFGKVGAGLANVGKVAATGLAVGIGAGAVALVGMTKNAVEDEAGQRKLALALRNSVDATDKQVASVESYISKVGVATGVTDDEMRPAFQRLVQATGSVSEAQHQMGIALDVSAGTGKSLKTVTEALMKANNGTTASLSRLGLKTKDAEGNALTLKQALATMSDTFHGQAAAAADTLGGKMARLRLIFDETKENIGAKLIPVLSSMGDWFLNQGIPALSTFGDWVSDHLMPKLHHLLDFIQTGLANAKDFAAPIVQKIRDALPQIQTALQQWRTAVGDFLQGVVVKVEPLISSIRTALDSGDWAPVGASLGNALAEAIGGAGAAVAKITQAIGRLLSKVDFVGLGIAMGKQAPAVVIGFAAGLLNFDLEGLLKGLWKHWQDVLIAGIVIFLTPVRIIGKIGEMLAHIPFVGRLLEWGLNAIKGFVDGVGSAIGDAIGHLGSAFLSGFRRVFPTIGSAFADALAVLPTRIAIAAIDVAQAAAELMQHLRGTIVGKIDNVVAAIGELVGKVIQRLGSLAGAGADAGWAMIQGMLGALRNGAQWVIDAARSLAQSAIDAVKNALKSHSPSKVTYQLGEFFVQGFAGGIKDKTKLALDAVKALVQRSVDKLKDLKAQAKQITDGVVSAMTGALDVGSLGAVDPETGVAASVTDQLAGFANQAGAFADALALAASHGLNSDLIAKVANLGPNQGLTAAQALAAMDRAQVASANASLAAVDKFAHQLGQTVLTTTSLPDDIARQQGILDTLGNIREDLKNNPQHIHFTINDAVDPDKVVNAIRKWLRQHGKHVGDLD